MSTASDSAIAPARKSRRIDDEEQEEKVFVPHPTLYFEDGNIILSAGRHLFRVHRSILAKHSPVLRELFDHKYGSLHGCPHVPLPHTSEELAALVDVVYDGYRIDAQQLTTETFPRLANILRMATRYGIDRVAAEVVSRIHAEWPSDLTKHWMKPRATGTGAAFQTQAPFSAPIPGSSHSHSQPAASAPTHIACGTHATTSRAPAQALLSGAYSSTPGAAASVHPAAVIALLRECGYSDPTLFFPLFYALSVTAGRSGTRELAQQLALLSTEDTARALIGIERLRAEHLRLASCPLGPAPHWCFAGIADLWAWIRWETRGDVTDPVHGWGNVACAMGAPGALAKYAICGQCAPALVAYLGQSPGRLWESLPAVFGLVEGGRVNDRWESFLSGTA